VRKDLETLDEPSDDPVLTAIADASARYGLPMEAFGELIDGCELDVRGTTYETLDALVGYCRLVAGSVGRLSLAVFGTDNPAAAVPLADDLGVALQLTNILRDVVEDRGMGRVYLPAEDARRYGCKPDLSGPPDALVALIASECAPAQAWFDRGLRLLPLLDRRSRACVAAMAGIYHHLLVRIERDPAAVTRGRLSLPTREKAWIAVRALAGADA
jgi:phytoene synthase